MSGLEATLTDAFSEETDDDTAAAAAENVAVFAAEYDEELTAETVLDSFEDAPYDEFAHAFNWLVGHLAAENEDCTDTREFRLDGFGELAADPDVAA